ncbi:MAG: 30S ribosomal protein S8 [Candidatus Diapherotrites archaeon]|nr:30S ribosomal protein S8 [Candidatus Diapherotrites archaeon]MDZ4256012.1 30S ribosomal protein S8 [archaeon]
MTQMDTLADALTHIRNSENASKKTILLKPASRLLGEILRVLQAKGYVGHFEPVEEGNKRLYRIELIGRINQVAAIKPRYAVKRNDFERFEKRYLPAKDMGTIIVSTSQGVLAHDETKAKAIGGRLLAYVY